MKPTQTYKWRQNGNLFSTFFSDGNVPSWARQLETRRMAVEQQHAEALQLIAGALTRIAETLERIERSLHQPPIP